MKFARFYVRQSIFSEKPLYNIHIRSRHIRAPANGIKEDSVITRSFNFLMDVLKRVQKSSMFSESSFSVSIIA